MTWLVVATDVVEPLALADPTGSSALTTAAFWVQQAMLGTVATLVAIIAVAVIGLLMMTGRIDWRRGATVVVGCFVLFGAPVIAAGLYRVANGQADDVVATEPVAVPPPAPLPQPAASAYDPYAGAAVPVRQ